MASRPLERILATDRDVAAVRGDDAGTFRISRIVAVRFVCVVIEFRLDELRAREAQLSRQIQAAGTALRAEIRDVLAKRPSGVYLLFSASANDATVSALSRAAAPSRPGGGVVGAVSRAVSRVARNVAEFKSALTALQAFVRHVKPVVEEELAGTPTSRTRDDGPRLLGGRKPNDDTHTAYRGSVVCAPRALDGVLARIPRAYADTQAFAHEPEEAWDAIVRHAAT